MDTSGASVEMPRYTSHKKVWALKIKEVFNSGTTTTTDESPVVTIYFENPNYGPRKIALRGKPTPEPGWYMIQYEDGYISFSPAKQFQEGYTPGHKGDSQLQAGPDLRSFSQEEMDNWFSYHAPTPDQLIAYSAIRTSAKIFAETVNRHVPASADKAAAMREIRGAVMAANLAVACFQKPKRPSIAELESMLQKDDDRPITIASDGSISVEP
jgi:hypothetical protein